MQLEGKLPPFDRPSVVPRRRPRPLRGARSLVRLFYRHQPGAILAVFALLVGVPLVLDFSVPAVRDWLDTLATEHEVGVNLLEHVLVAALVAAAAYYWVLGLKRQKALRSYRARAREKPWELVGWSRGESPVVRRATCELLADGIRRSEKAAVAVVQGRAGTGRTSFVVGLVEELARRELVPIPLLAPRDGSFALEAIARETFCRHVDEVLSSGEQADAIWHRARSSRDLVVLVDGLDDEVVATLGRDGGRQFRQTVRSLQSQRIAVVLATTRELPLGDIMPLREDLDSFSRDEAHGYLRASLQGPEPPDRAVAALDRLHDPVDESLVAPFYLDLIVRLHKAGIELHNLPEHTDRWRATVLGTYLGAIDSGDVVPSASSGDASPQDLHARGRKAKEAAEAVARKLTPERADLTATRKGLKIDDGALSDADDLNLLWRGAERVGLASDDLGAYLLATTQDDPWTLLDGALKIAEGEGRGKRPDRHVLIALIFWHLLHEGPQRLEAFERLLTSLEQRGLTRPAVVAATVRIAGACGLDELGGRVGAAVDACIDSLDTDEEREARPRQANELLRLVRALAGWHHPEAHRLLWRLATNQNVEIEWPAAKALAMAKAGPWQTLRPQIEDVLERAETHPAPAEMSHPDHELGNNVASLAWILPALRDSDDEAEAHLSRVECLCLAPTMSPLRGEMSLAQGLKLAILNAKAADWNVAHVRRLLFEHDGRGLRFWHARLVLVQALLAHAWAERERADELRKQLDALRSSERHPLVRRGVDLARDGLRELRRASNGSDLSMGAYMWIHERNAVRFVEQGKPRVTQLAADVVLLSNMTYRLRRREAGEADSAAAHTELPRCIRKGSERQNIKDGCDCARGLCRDPQPPAVLATRARFSESFCREQARLVAQLGPPPWTKRGLAAYRHAQRLKDFWDGQAEEVAQAEA